MTALLGRVWLVVRWLVAVGAFLFLLMSWVPAVSSEAPADRIDYTKFNPRGLSTLASVLLILAVSLPVARRARVWTIVTLALLTSLAWILEDEVRVLLGSPFSD